MTKHQKNGNPGDAAKTRTLFARLFNPSLSPVGLSIKSLRNRRGSVLLTTASLTLGVALLLGVERMRQEAHASFTNTLSGTDLIAGARTGQVSLLLSSIFRIGNPSQNISWESYQKIANNPQVAWTIPLSLGDSYRGYRVLGTSNAYFEHYRYADQQKLELAGGQVFDGTYDAVIGAETARKLGCKLNDPIVLSHGAGEVSFVDHADKPFRVSGILKPTGTPVDQTVHVSLEGIDAIHAGWDGHGGEGHLGHDHAEHAACEHTQPGNPTESDRLAALDALLEGVQDRPPIQITAFLIGMHSRADAVFLQRAINTYPDEALTAVMPGVALQELWQVAGIFEKTLLAITLFVVAVSLAGMLSTLMTSLNERRREMAILRSVGARPHHIVALIVGEAVAVTTLSCMLGVALLYLFIALARPYILAATGLHIGFSMLPAGELRLIAAVMLTGSAVGIIPALRCYRNSLVDGLAVNV